METEFRSNPSLSNSPPRKKGSQQDDSNSPLRTFATRRWLQKRKSNGTTVNKKYLFRPDEIERDNTIKQIFTIFDADNSGTLDVHEVHHMFKQTGIIIPIEALRKLFRKVTNSDSLNLQQFKDFHKNVVVNEEFRQLMREYRKEVAFFHESDLLKPELVPSSWETMMRVVHVKQQRDGLNSLIDKNINQDTAETAKCFKELFDLPEVTEKGDFKFKSSVRSQEQPNEGEQSSPERIKIERSGTHAPSSAGNGEKSPFKRKMTRASTLKPKRVEIDRIIETSSSPTGTQETLPSEAAVTEEAEPADPLTKTRRSMSPRIETLIRDAKKAGKNQAQGEIRKRMIQAGFQQAVYDRRMKSLIDKTKMRSVNTPLSKKKMYELGASPTKTREMNLPEYDFSMMSDRTMKTVASTSSLISHVKKGSLPSVTKSFHKLGANPLSPASTMTTTSSSSFSPVKHNKGALSHRFADEKSYSTASLLGEVNSGRFMFTSGSAYKVIHNKPRGGKLPSRLRRFRDPSGASEAVTEFGATSTKSSFRVTKQKKGPRATRLRLAANENERFLASVKSLSHL